MTRSDQAPPYASSGGVVVFQHKVLLLRSRRTGEYRLPKGHVEPGESAEEAAIREVIEETGYVSPVIQAPLGSRYNEFCCGRRRVRRTETYYLMSLADTQRQNRSLSEARKFAVCWVELNEAEQTLTFDFERAFVRKAIQIARSREADAERGVLEEERSRHGGE